MKDLDDESLEWLEDDDDSCSSWKAAKPEEPKIRRDPDGKVIFDAYLYGCMFDEDLVVSSIESMVGVSDVHDIPLLELFILRQQATERHKLCQYLFILMSLTHDEELLFALTKCTPLYDLGWRPSIKDLLTVFFNWGAPICLLCDKTCKLSWQPSSIHQDGNPRITSHNIKLVLHHMESALPHTLKEDATVDVLIRTFFLLFMEKIFVTTFTRRYLLHCLSTLVDQIPDRCWNQEKAWHVSELAFEGLEDQIQDLAVLCKKLFTLCDRCCQVGLHLAYRIVCQCFRTLEHRQEVDAPELPVTVSDIVQLILANSHRTQEMCLFSFNVMVDMMYTVIVKNSVTQDVQENIVKYLEYMLVSIRENYKSEDVTTVRQKILRFRNLLKLYKNDK
ncbi:uncharacterized protein LOC134531758 [Bacillus rossius redtenbacheri]|uniref:uncharacterized protein LOC134531758 n=1 Tax=Bacillus rossius redtenbacheri TaxID=93214 RepID=UPI002FDCA857